MKNLKIRCTYVHGIFLFSGNGIDIFFKNACPTNPNNLIIKGEKTSLMHDGKIAILPIAFEDFTLAWNEAKGRKTPNATTAQSMENIDNDVDVEEISLDLLKRERVSNE